MHADKNLRLAAATRPGTLVTSLAPKGKPCAGLRTAPGPVWVM